MRRYIYHNTEEQYYKNVRKILITMLLMITIILSTGIPWLVYSLYQSSITVSTVVLHFGGP